MFQLASPGQKNTKTPCFEVALMSFQATTEALPRPVFCPSGLIRILMVQFEHWASAFPWLSPFFSCQAERHLIRRLWAQVLKWQSRKWEKAIPIGRNQENACLLCVQENGAASNVGFAEQSIRTPHANASLGRTWEAPDAWRERASKTSPVLCWWSIWRRFRMVFFCCFLPVALCMYMLTDNWCANRIINPLSHTWSHTSVPGRPYELPWRRKKHLEHLVTRQLSGQKMGTCAGGKTQMTNTKESQGFHNGFGEEQNSFVHFGLLLLFLSNSYFLVKSLSGPYTPANVFTYKATPMTTFWFSCWGITTKDGI